MDGNNMIGEYLRARRELVQPGAVGLPAGGMRRVAGLRREEVAVLAGISADYYLRLEQGRDRNPSVQVLEALARALRLDRAATDYLLGLAAPQPPHRQPPPERETVPAGIRQLLDVLDLPAFVEGRYFDVLAANGPARALSPNLREGQNRLRAVFLDPGERALFPDWDHATARLVADFREFVGTHTDDPHFVRLVDELSQASERFRKLWARHDVSIPGGVPTLFRHPRVGDLTLSRENLVIGGAEGQMLVLYHAGPGTGSAERMALLASLATSTAPTSASVAYEGTSDATPGPPDTSAT